MKVMKMFDACASLEGPPGPLRCSSDELCPGPSLDETEESVFRKAVPAQQSCHPTAVPQRDVSGELVFSWAQVNVMSQEKEPQKLCSLGVHSNFTSH